MSNWRKIYPKSEDELDDLRDEVQKSWTWMMTLRKEVGRT